MRGTEDRLRSLVGLALRARRLALGRMACREAAGTGRLYLLLLARDAGRGQERIAGTAVRRLRLDVDQRELGAWLNRERVSLVGILDPHMAAGLLAAAQEPESEASSGVEESPGGEPPLGGE